MLTSPIDFLPTDAKVAAVNGNNTGWRRRFRTLGRLRHRPRRAWQQDPFASRCLPGFITATGRNRALIDKPRRMARVAALLVLASFATGSQATSFSDSLPEFSGNSTNTTQTIGTFVFDVPVGEAVTWAELQGHFGNSIAPTTSVHDVFADGVLVASCASHAAPCWPVPGNPDPWAYVFSGAELSIFSDGRVVMTSLQYDCCEFAVVREGAMTLRGLTAVVPEPGTGALALMGVACLALWARRRARLRNASGSG